ncbi:hypothetical protein ABW51_09545, partial [Haemophilus sp. C1]|uniref:hypothetical protein n=1 Tax=Haemophilus sp. C1 TaxID=1661745 RepID=UPI0006BFED1F
AYSQDSNSEENKPLPLNEEGYEARKKSITDNINKAVEDIKKKEKEVVYDTEFEDDQFSLIRKKNQNISGVFNTSRTGGYLFDVGGSDPKVNNLKLINNKDLASSAEVFTDQWHRPGVEHLAYIENNGNITGTGPNQTAHAIYLHSSEDFYFKNKGKITSFATSDAELAEILRSSDNLEISPPPAIKSDKADEADYCCDNRQRYIQNNISSSNLVVENEGSGSMLDKFDFNGGRVTFLNKENALVSNSSINAGTLIFSNKGVMGPRNDTPMTIDEFIKAGRGRYETPSENDYISLKYDQYERNFYHDRDKKVDEFIAAKDEYIAKRYGTKKFVPYKDYKKIIEEFTSRPGPVVRPSPPLARLPCEHEGCIQEDMVSTEDLFYLIDVDNFKESIKPKTIEEFVKECGKECDDHLKTPTLRTKSDYDFDYMYEFRSNTTIIDTKNLQGENTGTLSGTSYMKFKDGYFINSGSIDWLNVYAGKGLIVNRGTALLNIKDNGKDSELLTVDLKNSNVLKYFYHSEYSG